MVGEDYKISVAYDFRFPLRDTTGALQTGQTATCVIYLPDASTEASPPAPSELGSTGVYTIGYTFPATEGAYTFVVSATGCLPVVWTVQVRAESRDDLATPSNILVDPAQDQIMGRLLNAAISSRAATGDAMTLTTAYDAAKTAAKAGDDMGLSSAALTAILATANSDGVTLGQAITAAWARAYGSETYDESALTLTLDGPAGTAVQVWDITLNSQGQPVVRTRQ